MNTFYIALTTLIVYSLISFLIYLITYENENVLFVFGLGIIGLIVVALSKIHHMITNQFKYHIGKRSIFENKETGKKYKCKTKYTSDIMWSNVYKLVRRYATKLEYEGIPDFPDDFIKMSKVNCSHCKHNKKCDYDYDKYDNVRCKHDDDCEILEFDKFEKKGWWQRG